jgi:hemoglobin/transferrin/lactoferrin receptor protein
MKKNFTAFAVLLCFVSYSQQVRITDAENKQPIAEALLYTKDGKVTAYSDGKGFVNVSPFANADTIYIRQLGYQILSLPFSAFAKNNGEIQLQSGTLVSEEVVISANKWEQRRRELSGHAATVTRKDVELMNPQTAADLLTLSGAVFVQKSQQGGGSPMLRGFSTNRVLMVVDGVRMNTSIFRAGNVQNASRRGGHEQHNNRQFLSCRKRRRTRE